MVVTAALPAMVMPAHGSNGSHVVYTETLQPWVFSIEFGFGIPFDLNCLRDGLPC